MHKYRRFVLILIIVITLISAGAWYIYQNQRNQSGATIQASGTVEAVEIVTAPELSGRVVKVMVDKGDYVKAGDPLFQMDEELLQAQRRKAERALESSQANQTAAQTNLQMAQSTVQLAEINLLAVQAQYESVLSAARLAELRQRVTAWQEDTPSEFSQPVWYFEKQEEISAAQIAVDAARQALDIEKDSFEKVIQEASSDDLLRAEQRLVQAQAAFLVANDVLERAKTQRDDDLKDFAQDIYDAAEAELAAAQSDYESILSEAAAEDVKLARARVSVAQERYDTALDHLEQLLTGKDDRQVKLAEIALDQAHAALNQATIGLQQAQNSREQADRAVAQMQAELDLIDIQIKKLTIFSLTSGIVLNRNFQPGEVIQAGAPVMTIGQLDRVTITVFVPEDRYGQISLGQVAIVTVDSFPGQMFEATVVHIANKAEFTPRNVQTAEGRRTTVFAVELSIENQDGKLKPGMPADVRFNDR